MAKIQIRNDAQLNNIIYEAMAKAVEYTMVKLFQENEDLIQKYVYDKYPGEPYYDRTYEFMDAWNYKVKKASSRHMTGEFYYDPNVMHYNPSKAQHGTPDIGPDWIAPDIWDDVKSTWGDARDYLADILYQGKSGDLFGKGPWTEKRDAWTPLINKLDRGKIFTWFEEGMSKQKLKVYKR